MTSPRRHRGLWLGLAVVGLAAAGCSIETDDESTATTFEPATTIAPATTTTLPPELQPPDLDDVNVALSELVRYDTPTSIATRPGSESIYLGDRSGLIYEIKRDAKRNLEAGFTSYTYRPQQSAFLDISGQVITDGDDQGLYGLAFSSDGARLYVSYTNADGNTRIDEFRVSNGRVSSTSQRELLVIPQQDDQHNAGPLTMGPDGFLYIPLGDGGGQNDPFENGQNPGTLLGSILRIDPESGEGVAYNIPQGNPYAAGEGGLPEVFITGVRHPGGLSFDAATRDLWIVDRGEAGIQEITLIPWAGQAPRGVNLGWPVRNGAGPVDESGGAGDGPATEFVDPVFQYGPLDGCGTEGIVGGVLYRGTALIGLNGSYVYGDQCRGEVFAIDVEDGEVAIGRSLGLTVEPGTLSAIGADPDGELIVTTTDGIVYQIVNVEPEEPPA